MAAPRRTPLFLARRAYRRRRLMDAARLLPLAALGLWMLPLLWGGPGAPGAGTRVIYLFAVWAALILGAFALSHRLRDAAEHEAAEAGTPPGASPTGRSDGTSNRTPTGTGSAPRADIPPGPGR
ncbi:hypothetical protein V8J36_11555 [Frigidibacter sp. MR17.14]|uniref:hypothetical protein n=1 Tax=Frigidibacter sp. MR17.14 TaxID=3126509 RepID=UPI003012FA61